MGGSLHCPSMWGAVCFSSARPNSDLFSRQARAASDIGPSEASKRLGAGCGLGHGVEHLAGLPERGFAHVLEHALLVAAGTVVPGVVRRLEALR